MEREVASWPLAASRPGSAVRVGDHEVDERVAIGHRDRGAAQPEHRGALADDEESRGAGGESLGHLLGREAGVHERGGLARQLRYDAAEGNAASVKLERDDLADLEGVHISSVGGCPGRCRTRGGNGRMFRGDTTGLLIAWRERVALALVTSASCCFSAARRAR